MSEDDIFKATLENIAQIHGPWLEAVRRDPAVYAPHSQYEGCCEFGSDHPIHTERIRRLFDDNLEYMRVELEEEG